ncbi:MAG: hypothetical protein ACKN9T_06600, partial [Candidatus Methylumidiphilus sp.]
PTTPTTTDFSVGHFMPAQKKGRRKAPLFCRLRGNAPLGIIGSIYRRPKGKNFPFALIRSKATSGKRKTLTRRELSRSWFDRLTTNGLNGIGRIARHPTTKTQTINLDIPTQFRRNPPQRTTAAASPASIRLSRYRARLSRQLGECRTRTDEMDRQRDGLWRQIRRISISNQVRPWGARAAFCIEIQM